MSSMQTSQVLPTRQDTLTTADKSTSTSMPAPRSPKTCTACGLCILCGLSNEIAPWVRTATCTICHNSTNARARSARRCDHHPTSSRVSHGRVSKPMGPRAMPARRDRGDWRREMFESAERRLEQLDKGIRVCDDRLTRNHADITSLRKAVEKLTLIAKGEGGERRKDQ